MIKIKNNSLNWSHIINKIKTSNKLIIVWIKITKIIKSKTLPIKNKLIQNVISKMKNKLAKRSINIKSLTFMRERKIISMESLTMKSKIINKESQTINIKSQKFKKKSKSINMMGSQTINMKSQTINTMSPTINMESTTVKKSFMIIQINKLLVMYWTNNKY